MQTTKMYFYNKQGGPTIEWHDEKFWYDQDQQINC